MDRTRGSATGSLSTEKHYEYELKTPKMNFPPSDRFKVLMIYDVGGHKRPPRESRAERRQFDLHGEA